MLNVCLPEENTSPSRTHRWIQKYEDYCDTPAERVAKSLIMFGGNRQQAEGIKDKREDIIRTAPEIGLSSEQVREKVSKCNEELHSLEKVELGKRKGPISGSLDEIMSDQKVYVQPFHKRSYLGNDSHRYFKE